MATWICKKGSEIGTLMQLNHQIALCNVHSVISMNTINNSDYVGPILIPWKPQKMIFFSVWRDYIILYVSSLFDNFPDWVSFLPSIAYMKVHIFSTTFMLLITIVYGYQRQNNLLISDFSYLIVATFCFWSNRAMSLTVKISSFLITYYVRLFMYAMKTLFFCNGDLKKTTK